ncbi:MAG: hypothetical protein AAFX78_01780 [Cyanobacteria bacterium J06638_20]
MYDSQIPQEAQFSQEVLHRIYEALDLDPNTVHLALKPGEEYLIYAIAKVANGDRDLGRLVSSPEPISHLEAMTCADKIILVRHNTEPITEYTIQSHLPMQNHLIDLLPVATALKCGLFIVHYTGHYLAYFNADENANLIQNYEQMMGQRAAELLPEPIQSTVKEAHAKAIQTGQASEYFYDHPTSGRRRKAVVIPYPQHQQLAIFTMDATAPVAIPA